MNDNDKPANDLNEVRFTVSLTDKRDIKRFLAYCEREKRSKLNGAAFLIGIALDKVEAP